MMTEQPTWHNSGYRPTERHRLPDAGNNPAGAGEFTGRFLVIFDDLETGAAVASLREGPGLSVASSSDFADRAIKPPADASYAMLFESIGIAVVDAPPEQLDHLRSAGTGGMQIVPERYMFAAGSLSVDPTYFDGFLDGVTTTIERLRRAGAVLPLRTRLSSRALQRARSATTSFTWNIERVDASVSKFAGRGIRVAVLDTGYDARHPDFAGRSVDAVSFVPGATVHDGHGHGTHCLGIACGSRSPVSAGPIYGCAADADILVGKVLADNGSGQEGWVLNGIDWALERDADIVSLSIEGPHNAADQVLVQYEAVGKRALQQGRLLIAAAGNRSARPLFTRPVASPACASTVMAVAALAPDDSVAPFSCSGGPAANVDIAAPGVAIESSFPMPRGRKVDSGTSMAAPLVAGVAAMFAQADPKLRGRALWDKLIATADSLAAPATDVGAGCVQAP